MDRLSEIRARCEAFEDSNDSYKDVRPKYILPVLADDGYSRNWAEIAAHSHEDIPYLLTEIERLQAENKRLDIEDAKDALRGDTLRGELQKMTARAEKAEAEIKSIHEALCFADKCRLTCTNYTELAVSNGLALGKIAVAIQHDYDAEPPKEGE